MNRKFLAAGLVNVAMASFAYGQVSTATVSGSVADTTGALIVNAQVVATNVLTGVSATAATNEKGEYNFQFLPPGTYTISVVMTGFKKYQQVGLALSSGDHPTVDIPLQIGDNQQTVEVGAQAPLLGTEDASLGQVVPAQLVENLPLNGRTPMSFAQYTVGVVATTNPVGVHAYDNSAVSAFSVGGLPNKNSEILMDGSPDNASDNAIAYSPPVDATSELRINVFASDATYGHAGGAVANQITKSGTNRLHGTLSEYNQISALNANSYFNQRTNTRKGVSEYNQYGGTIGGPIFVPKLYNGRDKAFFFFGYEGIRNRSPNNTTLTVPTDAERTGDFSALLPLGTTRTDTECTGVTSAPYNSYAIFDPSTATLNAACAAKGITVYDRKPFANNIITSNGATLNPVAVAALQFYPKANVAAQANGAGNYFSKTNNIDRYDNEIGRFDVNLSARNRFYLTGRHSERQQIVAQYFGASDPALGDVLQRVNLGGSVGDIATISPSLVTEVRLNYTRYEQNSITNGDGFNASAVGLPNLQSNHHIFPRFYFNTFQNLGSTTMTPGVAPFNSYDIFGDIIKIVGLHSIKAGVDARRFQKGQFNYGDSSGRYSFDSRYTAAFSTDTYNAPIGQDLAAFLLGDQSSGSYDLNAHAVGTQTYFGLFVQDDWRARPDLTLNFGMRYDRDLSPYERSGNAVSGFDTTSANPISGAAIAAYSLHPLAQLPAANFKVNGGLTFASPTSRDFSHFTSNMFSPRIGLAFTPKALGGKTVIRSGFGIFVIPIFPFNNAINQSGFSQTTQSPTGSVIPNAATLSNPFPTGLVQPTGSTGGLSTFAGQNITVLAPTIRNAYSERWHLGVQHQLPGNWLTEIYYEGSTGRRLPINQPLNFVPAQYLTTASNPALSAQTTNPFAGLLPNGGSNNNATVATTQLLSVYPEFGTITVQNAPNGGSIYHALDLHVEHRAGNGLSIIANYQWSKLLEAVTYLNNFDPRPEYRISQYDRATHAVIALSYELPYGRSRRYGATIPRWLDLPLGGWNIASSWFYQVGAPLTFGNITPTGAALNYNPRLATQTVGFSTVPSFNTAAFSSTIPVNNIRTFGSQFSRYRADALNDWDASIQKNFNMTEHTYVQFRGEAFNVNNRPVFSGPNVTPNSSSFAQITSTQNSPRTIQLGGRIVF